MIPIEGYKNLFDLNNTKGNKKLCLEQKRREREKQNRSKTALLLMLQIRYIRALNKKVENNDTTSRTSLNNS